MLLLLIVLVLEMLSHHHLLIRPRPRRYRKVGLALLKARLEYASCLPLPLPLHTATSTSVTRRSCSGKRRRIECRSGNSRRRPIAAAQLRRPRHLTLIVRWLSVPVLSLSVRIGRIERRARDRLAVRTRRRRHGRITRMLRASTGMCMSVRVGVGVGVVPSLRLGMNGHGGRRPLVCRRVPCPCSRRR